MRCPDCRSRCGLPAGSCRETVHECTRSPTVEKAAAARARWRRRLGDTMRPRRSDSVGASTETGASWTTTPTCADERALRGSCCWGGGRRGGSAALVADRAVPAAAEPGRGAGSREGRALRDAALQSVRDHDDHRAARRRGRLRRDHRPRAPVASGPGPIIRRAGRARDRSGRRDRADGGDHPLGTAATPPAASPPWCSPSQGPPGQRRR